MGGAQGWGGGLSVGLALPAGASDNAPELSTALVAGVNVQRFVGRTPLYLTAMLDGVHWLSTSDPDHLAVPLDSKMYTNRFMFFPDYTVEEMMAIFKMRCGKGYTLAEDAEPLVRDYIAEESADQESFGNGRGVRNLFENIVVAQNNRLAKLESVTREQLMELTADDVLHARGKIDEE